MENSEHCKTAVIGFGNILMGDEGIGVHIVKKLQMGNARYKMQNVEFIDGGTSALDVLLLLKDIDKLVIIDAVKNGGQPGSIYKFQNSMILEFQSNKMQETSLHDLNLVDALKIADKLGTIPKEIVFIGVEPKEIEPKMELSEKIRNKIPEIIKTVLCEVKQ